MAKEPLESANSRGLFALELTVFKTFEDAKTAWRAFADQVPGFVYQQYDWCKIWYDTYGQKEGFSPHIVLVKGPSGQTLMLVPLCVKKEQLGTTAYFIGEGMSDYLAPLIQEDFALELATTGFEGLWQQILASFETPVDLVWFDRQPEFILDVPNPFYQLPGTPFASSAHALIFPQAANWHEGARMVRSNKTAKKIERRIRQLAKTGEISFIEVTAQQDRQRHFDELLALKIENLDDAGILHKMDHKDVATFYNGVVANQEISDALCHFEMRCADKLVATVFGLIHHDRFFYQICAFNRQDFGQYSPGLLLLYQLFDWTFARGLKSFDMTIGDEAYKADWSNKTTPLKNIAQGFTTKGKIDLARRKATIAIKEKVKATPMLKSLALKVLRR